MSSSSELPNTSPPEARFRVTQQLQAPRPAQPRRLSNAAVLGISLVWLVVVALGAEVAYLWASSRPDVWLARSEIEYRGVSWVETQSVAVNSRSLTEPIADSFGISLIDFQRRLTAGQVPGTEVIRVDFRGEDQAQNVEIVRAYTSAYMDGLSDDSLTRGVDLIEAELESLRVELAVAEADLAALPPVRPDAVTPTEQLELRSRTQMLREQISQLEVRQVEKELQRIDQELNRPVIISAPHSLPEPIEPKPLRRAVLGALAGALVASALAYALVRSVS